MNEQLMKELRKPFKPDEIEWRIGVTSQDKAKGLALAFVTNRAIQNRLDDVFGCFNWQNEFREWKGKAQICGISVWDSEKEQWITKWDGADDSNMESTKGGLSDSMKRAAYHWGIGRYLYSLPSVWVPIEKRGNSYFITKNPTLPKWALPEGWEGSPPPKDAPQNRSEAPQDAPGQQAGSKPDTDPLKKEIRQMLWAMSYENKEEALSLLEQFTRFTKDGKDIPGKTDINKISDKQLPVTHKQVTEAYKQWKAAREKENDEAAEAMGV